MQQSKLEALQSGARRRRRQQAQTSHTHLSKCTTSKWFDQLMPEFNYRKQRKRSDQSNMCTARKDDWLGNLQWCRLMMTHDVTHVTDPWGTPDEIRDKMWLMQESPMMQTHRDMHIALNTNGCDSMWLTGIPMMLTSMMTHEGVHGRFMSTDSVHIQCQRDSAWLTREYQSIMTHVDVTCFEYTKWCWDSCDCNREYQWCDSCDKTVSIPMMWLTVRYAL